MTRRKHPGGDAGLHGLGQAQETQGIGDLRARAAKALRQLLLRDTEVLEQLLVRARLLERVQLSAMEILEQSIPQHGVVGGIAHDRGDRVETGEGGCSQSTLAHDELVARLAGTRSRALAHHDGLQHPELAHGVHELLERFRVELGARLLRVGHDVGRRDRREAGPGNGGEISLRRCWLREEDVDRPIAVGHRNERADAAAEPRSLGRHQVAAPLCAISAAASRYEREPGELVS